MIFAKSASVNLGFMCGGHLHFLRGMKHAIFCNHNVHALFHILTAPFALI